MKNLRSSVYSILFVMVLFTSCLPPIQEAPQDPRTFDAPQTDLLELGYSLPYFEDFMYVMKKTNLTSLLEDEGPYTVFAPVQYSFAVFRLEHEINHLDQYPVNELKNILLYHIIPGNWRITSIPVGYHPTLLYEETTRNPTVLYIQNYDIFRINGMNILDEPDLATVNGYIQSIRSVLKIPTILDQLSYNDDFDMFLKMLSRKDLDTDYLTLLSDDERVTFLVPTNDAILSFINNNSEWENVDDIPASMINEILKDHQVDGKNIVLNNIKDDMSLTLLSGEEITVHIDYPRWTILRNNKKMANINIRDIQGSNGIIHQIDRVLLP